MLFLVFVICLYINYKFGVEGFIDNSKITMIAVIGFMVIGGIMLFGVLFAFRNGANGVAFAVTTNGRMSTNNAKGVMSLNSTKAPRINM